MKILKSFKYVWAELNKESLMFSANLLFGIGCVLTINDFHSVQEWLALIPFYLAMNLMGLDGVRSEHGRAIEQLKDQGILDENGEPNFLKWYQEIGAVDENRSPKNS